MRLVIRREPSNDPEAYGSVSCRFVYDTVLSVRWDNHGLEVVLIREAAVDPPVVKDYDEAEPVTRSRRFGDISHWRIFAAFLGERRLGGAVVAFDTPNIRLLEDRAELGLLWDLRVDADNRRSGIGTALVREAVAFAKASGLRRLKVETQNVNVAAYRFYARQGFRLEAIHPGAYADYPEEIQMLWYVDLD